MNRDIENRTRRKREEEKYNHRNSTASRHAHRSIKKGFILFIVSASSAASMRFSTTIFFSIFFFALATTLHAQNWRNEQQPFRLFLPPRPATTTSTVPPRPTPATGPLVALDTATTGGARQKTAADLLTSNPSLAGAVVTNILQRGEPISESLSKVILTLPADSLLAAVSAHANFPAQLDSEFLRAAALAKENPISTAAIALLASKHCIKNDATLDTLATALSSGNPARIVTLLQNFESDTEFARMPRLSATAEDSSNDRFGAGFVTGSVLAGMAAPDFQPDRRRIGSHIPVSQWPGLGSMFKFLSALETVARNMQSEPAIQNRAYEILFSESATSSLPKLLISLLRDNHPAMVQLAQHVALRYPTDSQLIEIVLQSVLDGKTRLHPSVYTRLAPFLVREEGGRTRPLARIARRLVACPDVERRLPGLVLLAAHGVPGDISLLLQPSKIETRNTASTIVPEPALLTSPDPYVRRAAAHALARLSPEVFLIHMPAIVADADASVRATVPLAFFKTGYRWEHRPAAGLHIGEWIVPSADFAISKANFEMLHKLSSDTDVTIRHTVRLALLQNGCLEKSDTLTDLAEPVTEALPTARLVQSATVARAAGLPIPAALDAFSPAPPPKPKKAVDEDLPQSFPLLAVFAPPQGGLLRALDEAVSEFRLMEPGTRVLYYFNGTDSARFALDALCQVFPLSPEQRAKPVIVFRDGVWFATDTAPDMALLRELNSCEGDSGAARRVELALRVAAQDRSQAGVKSEDEWWANMSQKMRKGVHESEDSPLTNEIPQGTSVFYWLIGISIIASILAIAASYLWAWHNRRIEYRTGASQRKH